MAKNISDLSHALAHSDELTRLLDVRSPAVFLNYDGTLTPIVDRPEDAVISYGMRRTVRELAGHRRARGGRRVRGVARRGKEAAPRGARSHRGCPGRAQENLDCGALPAGLRRGAS